MIALCLATLAWGSPQEPVNPFEEADESELFALDEQLVTVSSRYAQTIDKAPNIVSLVSAQTIEERGYRTLSDVLRDMPGLYLTRSAEGRDLVSFRGIVSPDNNKILLLIDGVAWYDGVYTHAPIDDFLPLANIKQVEVIKGPGSAVYGTNAFAGVVNVVTYTPAELDGVRARWMVGHRDRSDITVMAGSTLRVAGLNVGASATARIMSQDGEGLDITPGGGRDLLGEDPKSGALIGARLNIDGLRLSLDHVDYRHSFLANDANDPVGIANRDGDQYGLTYHNTSFRAAWELEPADRIQVTPQFYTHRYDNPGSYYYTGRPSTVANGDGTFTTTLPTTAIETNKDTRRIGASVELNARPILDHITVAGVGTQLTRIVPGPGGEPGVIDIAYTNEDPDGSSTGFEATGSLLNVFAYAQHTWTALPALELVFGGRYDQRFPVNSDDDPTAPVFAPTATPRAGILLVPNDEITVKVLYGRAFRAPNVRELLVDTTELDDEGLYRFSSGSLNVRPESIDTVEGEIAVRPADGIELRASGSWSLVSREIDKISPPNEYRNLDGGLSVVAAELMARAEYKSIAARVAYALTVAQYGNSGPYAGRTQYEIPPHMVKASVVGRLGDHLSSTLLAELYGPRPRSAWSPTVGSQDGDPYALLHLSGRASGLGPKERFGVGFAVRNLLDSQYSTPLYRDEANRGSAGDPRNPNGIQGEGRAAYVTVDVAL